MEYERPQERGPSGSSSALLTDFWTLDQYLSLYYELGLHVEVSNQSIADPALFMHVALLIAAVATFPHQNVPGRKLYRTILNSLFLLFFWTFLYGYLVFPYQYFPNASRLWTAL